MASASSQWLSAADAAPLQLSTTGTLEAYFNFASTPASGGVYVLLAKDNQGTQRSFATFLRNNAGTLRLEIIVLGNATDDYYFWNWTPTTNTWYRLSWTINTANPSATTFELFVDGVSQGNGTAIDAGNVTTITNSTATFTIGAADGGVQFCDGRVDDIRVWNVVRTSTQINSSKATQLSGNETGLVAYWPFEAAAPIATGGAFLLQFV